MPSRSRRSKLSAPCHKVGLAPTAEPRPAQSYVVVDVTLPSHIINDRSLFTTYMPKRQVHRNAFGNNVTIEGTGNVQIRVFAAGKSIVLRMKNCWHVPSSPHHFLSCIATTSIGCQVMIASRAPRILFPHKSRLSNPSLPKYIPLTKMDGYFVLKYEIPVPGSVFPQQTSTAANQTPAISLHASAYQPFAGLAELRKSEHVDSEQRAARAEETVQPEDGGKIVNVNGGAVLCAAGDGVVDVVNRVIFVGENDDDENSEFGLFAKEDCTVIADSRRAAPSLARLSAPGQHPCSPTSSFFPFSPVPSSPSSPPSHVNPTSFTAFTSVSMNLYTLPSSSTIPSPGYPTHRLISVVPNVDEATDHRTVGG
jgi:hypothetical protein